MFTRSIAVAALAIAGLSPALSGNAQAQKDGGTPPLDEIKRQLELALPPELIGDDNRELAANLLSVELGEPLSKTFNYARVRNALFGRTTPALAPDCQRTGTPVGEPSQEECEATQGSENGEGEFKKLAFSRNLGVGNIKFMYRPPVPKEDVDPATMKSVALRDDQAYEMALKLMGETFGLPLNEVANPPQGAALPVKSLAIGLGEGEKALPGAIVRQKVVFLPRGLNLPKPIPVGNFLLTKVPAPGGAWVALGDPDPTNPDPAKRMGLKAAVISDWIELRRNDKLDPGMAKSRDELIDEMAEQIANEDSGPLGIIAILIGLSVDSRGSYGLLLPAVQVQISPLPKDLTEEQQHALQGQATAGHIFEVPLIKSVNQDER
jgi:hypothetical protein